MIPSIFHRLHRSWILPLLTLGLVAGCAAPTETADTPDAPDTGETGSTGEALSAGVGPSDFVATNLSSAGMWVTIYNTFGRIVASGCVEPNKMVIFDGLIPVLPHEVRLELTNQRNCQGGVFRQLWITISVGAFGSGWLDNKYEWHGSILPPIPSLAGSAPEEPASE